MRKKKELIQTILLALIVGIIIFVGLSNEPKGYYKATYEVQPDGTHYIWVEE